MLIVYGMSDSGNCYKVKLALEQLGLAYRWVEVDPVKGETASAAFLAKNPNGKVPTLELENGEFLPESNAILNYLADGTPLLPGQRLARARVLQWMFFEQYSHEPYVAVPRSITRSTPTPIAPPTAASTWGNTRRCAPGSSASPRSRATCRCICGRVRHYWTDIHAAGSAARDRRPRDHRHAPGPRSRHRDRGIGGE